MAFAPKRHPNLSPSRSEPVLAPIHNKPRARQFRPLPGVGVKAKRGLGAPRHELQQSGSSRIHILVDQVAHATADLQLRAAVQELSLLASTSDACRLAILSAGGDKALIRLLQRSESDGLLRWTCATLSSLAVDDWSRRRLLPVVARVFELVARSDLEAAFLHSGAKSETDYMVLEAACLLANVIHSREPRQIYDSLGGIGRLYSLTTGSP